MEARNNNSLASPLPLFVHVMGKAVVRREWRWNIMWSTAESLLLFLPPAHAALIFVCRAKRTSVRLPLRRMAEHPPFLKIGCTERRLKIDLPLITVSLKYFSATATFKHHSLSRGFYNPYHIPVLVMEIPHNKPSVFWIRFVPSTRTCSVHIPLPAIRGW